MKQTGLTEWPESLTHQHGVITGQRPGCEEEAFILYLSDPVDNHCATGWVNVKDLMPCDPNRPDIRGHPTPQECHKEHAHFLRSCIETEPCVELGSPHDPEHEAIQGQHTDDWLPYEQFGSSPSRLGNPQQQQEAACSELGTNAKTSQIQTAKAQREAKNSNNPRFLSEEGAVAPNISNILERDSPSKQPPSNTRANSRNHGHTPTVTQNLPEDFVEHVFSCIEPCVEDSTCLELSATDKAKSRDREQHDVVEGATNVQRDTENLTMAAAPRDTLSPTPGPQEKTGVLRLCKECLNLFPGKELTPPDALQPSACLACNDTNNPIGQQFIYNYVANDCEPPEWNGCYIVQVLPRLGVPWQLVSRWLPPCFEAEDGVITKVNPLEQFVLVKYIDTR
ncbi:hypothetical protein B0T14DRAFT_129171 [Immersiella caudata]|uniref:Uncharacterized protein n=1 Tax=Immersiella caudata TaxID=314043 RepID=A0AA40C7L4_9PEZI|nr:hypothetical protein B0T14DRAFT_129171 [Immersiella caudata]